MKIKDSGKWISAGFPWICVSAILIVPRDVMRYDPVKHVISQDSIVLELILTSNPLETLETMYI